MWAAILLVILKGVRGGEEERVGRMLDSVLEMLKRCANLLCYVLMLSCIDGIVQSDDVRLDVVAESRETANGHQRYCNGA